MVPLCKGGTRVQWIFLSYMRNVFFLIEYRGGGLTPAGRVFFVARSLKSLFVENFEHVSKFVDLSMLFV
jgi:hypothetical protein